MAESQNVVRANIRGAMARHDISQAHIAKALRVTQQAVSQKLSGRRSITIDELEVIAAAIGVRPEELYRPIVRSEPVPA